MPAGTRITQPQGGNTLWIELAENIDTLKLAEQALAESISIAAGPLFSASDKYKLLSRFMRPTMKRGDR
jgi:DNA-binding transcriptional MocR family regulator